MLQDGHRHLSGPSRTSAMKKKLKLCADIEDEIADRQYVNTVNTSKLSISLL